VDAPSERRETERIYFSTKIEKLSQEVEGNGNLDRINEVDSLIFVKAKRSWD
jgi:hypothetical protein